MTEQEKIGKIFGGFEFTYFFSYKYENGFGNATIDFKEPINAENITESLKIIEEEQKKKGIRNIIVLYFKQLKPFSNY